MGPSAHVRPEGAPSFKFSGCLITMYVFSLRFFVGIRVIIVVEEGGGSYSGLVHVRTGFSALFHFFEILSLWTCFLWGFRWYSSCYSCRRGRTISRGICMVRCFPRFSVFLLLSYRIFQHISKFLSTWGLCTGFIFLSAGLKGISLLFFRVFLRLCTRR
jgi:hypothetical protein